MRDEIRKHLDRRGFIGGSDARIIMSNDPKAILQLWREKRGEAEPVDLSNVLIAQLGLATEDLNRRWFERHSNTKVQAVQSRVFHSHHKWLAATLDGMILETTTVFEAKFMLPWSFTELGAAAKYMPQLQHNMLAAGCSRAVLSIITGGGKWIEIPVAADPIYQAVLIETESLFWEAVQTGRPPVISDVEVPPPRVEALRVVDMSASNAWATFANQFRETHAAFLAHEQAKDELKLLLPNDAKAAVGHGVRARRSKSGAVSFDLVAAETLHAKR